jgi:uncharacterized membrane protein YidH (DUF202 family)
LDISVDWFSLSHFALLGLYDPLYGAIYSSLISSPILTLIPILILIIGIVIALLGVLRLLHHFDVIEGGDTILGHNSLIIAFILIIAAGAVAALAIIEFVIVSTKVLNGLKSFHEIFELLFAGSFLPELSTSAKPLAGLYLTLIPAAGIIVLFSYY